jgi:hypothetical protein
MEMRPMDLKRRRELISLLARDEMWEDPADIFTGESGYSGPEYVVALRAALKRVYNDLIDAASDEDLRKSGGIQNAP